MSMLAEHRAGPHQRLCRSYSDETSQTKNIDYLQSKKFKEQNIQVQSSDPKGAGYLASLGVT